MNNLDISPLSHGDSPWYVIWSEARAEKKVAERLSAKGCSVWLPTVTEKHRWSDRWKMVTKPLFPGYLFAATGEGYEQWDAPAQPSTAYVERLRRTIAHLELAVELTPPEELDLPGDEMLVRESPPAGIVVKC